VARPLLIDGAWRTGRAAPVASVNPANGETNYEVSAADAEDVDEAVTAAAAAFQGRAWRRRRPHERALVLHRIADGIAAQADALARAQMAENGKILAECRVQVASAAATFRYYAAVCETLPSAVTPSRGPYVSMTIFEPLGVVAAITPWNSPLTMEAQKIAPALAAGNSIIVKPSEVTPGVALELGRICQEAGIPAGVINILPGTGAETGDALVTHPGVRMVSFTGGAGTGRRIAVAAAQRGIPAVLELGGKSPNIVFADADLERAVDGVIGGIFASAGQSCVAGSRLYVEASVYEAFMARLIDKTRALRIGDPSASTSEIGPLASFPGLGRRRTPGLGRRAADRRGT